MSSDATAFYATIQLIQNEKVLSKDRYLSGKFRPSFNHNGQLVACIVESLNDNEWIQVGVEQPVIITLPYGKQLGWSLPAGLKFQLNCGKELVGKGVIVNEPKL